jgi:hypothetical protein
LARQPGSWGGRYRKGRDPVKQPAECRVVVELGADLKYTDILAFRGHQPDKILFCSHETRIGAAGPGFEARNFGGTIGMMIVEALGGD